MSAAVTPADGDERKQAEHLVETVVVKTRKPGRPPKKIKRIAGDKGYDSQKLRAFLLSKGIAPQIPRKKNAAPRFHIERTFGSRENSAAWLFDGRGCRNASILGSPKDVVVHFFRCWKIQPNFVIILKK